MKCESCICKVSQDTRCLRIKIADKYYKYDPHYD